MVLSSSQLEAFRVVAEVKSFSLAAAKLELTQSALSQRVAKLEKQLGGRLFLRQGQGMELTEAGWKVFRYCQQIDTLEGDLLNELQGQKSENFSGLLRIMVKPTLLQTFVQPTLTPLLRLHPALDMAFMSETDRSMDLLEREEIHYVITDRVFERPALSSYVLGQEEFVMVESSRYRPPASTYLDLENGNFLFDLLRREGERIPNVRRRFFSDLPSMVDAVKQGLGRTVLPRQMIAQESGLREVSSFAAKRFPVVLNFVERPVQSRLHTAMVESLSAQSSRYFP